MSRTRGCCSTRSLASSMASPFAGQFSAGMLSNSIGSIADRSPDHNQNEGRETMATRREWLLASGAFAAALTIGSRSGFAQGAKTLKVGFGQKAISPNLINLLIGETLGYNGAEGFKVQGMALGGNNNVQVA